MGTTADKLAYLNDTKTAIKNAIIAKGVAMPDGTTFRQYAEKISDIIDVPDLSNPGAAGDLRSGKQLVGADGGIITGTLAEVTQATPSISVSSGGLITAKATQSGGIVAAGSKSATQQLTTQGEKTVTPGTTTQTAVAAGRYTTGDVQVAGDANLVAENIAEGVSIFGVTGTHSGGATCTVHCVEISYDLVLYYISASGDYERAVVTQDADFVVSANSYLLTSVYSDYPNIGIQGAGRAVAGISGAGTLNNLIYVYGELYLVGG